MITAKDILHCPWCQKAQIDENKVEEFVVRDRINYFFTHRCDQCGERFRVCEEVPGQFVVEQTQPEEEES